MKRRVYFHPRLVLKRPSARTRLSFAASGGRSSNYIALASLLISLFSLLVTGYMSAQSTRKQDEANAIQERYSESERNAKIAALVTELSSKTSTEIDFQKAKPLVDEQLRKRSSETLLVLNSLFMVTRGTTDWDGYILDASERPLKSLKHRGTRVQCQIWSETFRTFVFDEKWAPVNSCLVCSDISCDN